MMQRSSRQLVLLAAALALLVGCDRFTSAATRTTRAAASLQAGEYQSALIDLHKALDAEPRNLDAQLLLVDVLTASGDLEAARVQLDRAVVAGAKPAATESSRLNLLLALRNADNVRKALETSTALSPVQRATYEGRLLLLEQKPADAQAAFDKALATDPNLSEAALGRIDALTAQGQIKPAQEALAALLKREPQSGRALLLKGMLARRSGDPAAAAADLTNALEHGQGMTREQRLQAHVARLEIQLNGGQLEQARAAMPALEAAAGGAPIVALMRARIALTAGDATTAANELRTFTQAVAHDMTGRLLLVAALQEQGSLEQAFAEAVRVLSEFPDRDESRLVLASVQLRLGRIADAEETLQPLVAQTPASPDATALLAEIRVRGGDASAGVALLEQTVSEHPENAALKLQLATAYLATGEARRALQVLDTVTDPAVAARRDRLHAIATASMEGPATVERELSAALARHPDDVDLLVTAAGFAASTGQIDQARAHMQRALRIRPDSPALMQALARLELADGRITEAEALAKSALGKVPNDAATMVLMASIAAQRGADAEADAWLNRARLTNPGAVDVSMALARKAARRGDAAQARSILKELVAHSPSNPGARVALAELLASQGQYAEALRGLREAMGQHPDSFLIPLLMAKVQIAAKDDPAARGSLRQALKLNPGWLQAATLLAGIEIRSGNLQGALAAARAVRDPVRDGNAADLLEGEVYLAMRRPVEAVKTFTAAYQRKPGSVAALRLLQAKVQAKVANPDAELQDWVMRTPADSGARRTLSDYYLSTGRKAEAIVQLEQVVAARPTDAVALNNLAWLYQDKADARAQATAEKAYTAAPNVGAIADTYGWILVQAGKAPEGVKVLEKAAQLASGRTDIRFHYAAALAQTGEKEKAITLLRSIVRGGAGSASLAEARKLLSDLGG